MSWMFSVGCLIRFTTMNIQLEQLGPIIKDRLAQIRDDNGSLLDETIRNLRIQRKVKNILLVGIPSAGKSSFINSLVSLILGKFLPVASVGQGVQQTHTYAAHRYEHFGITQDHLQGSLNEETARIIQPYLPNLDDFVGLSDANTDEIKEVLSLKVFGYLQPGIQINALFNLLRAGGVGYLKRIYAKSKAEWKTDIVIFVHSVASTQVPTKLIECLLEVIRPKHTLCPVDVDLYVVLTKMDKVRTGEVSKKTLEAIESDIASAFSFHGFKEYKLFKITNWCDTVGFLNSSADSPCELDERSVTLNNQLLKLLRNVSIPKAEQEPIEEITDFQSFLPEIYMWCARINTIVQAHLELWGARDILYAGIFGFILILVVYFLLAR
ncbi:hypothetical protein CHS0354_004308 [Potamilus streckersoni]|uniref:Uncharacterized protein n=1 Tax=Potamilus streckersoni TaxID=2493646 RepID=A0AAE0S4F3_9BIVA|nr:hypothetical protein CHS0354_004308 [Potamilus streckersoni]